ncbi:uncharacterized protein LOC128966336 [Oppia nitens]|uniref:uncharacterized protein LOC128966336 n=1 Tax=Oppia nitens TaxID=1686743 RepID=UPI0023D9F09F|nr:uncharacterized protein LOC128966336 [Oppia nitens]
MMCSETLIQDYHNRGSHVPIQLQSNHLPGRSSVMVTGVYNDNCPVNNMNTLTGESNIYMEPSLTNCNYQTTHPDNYYNSLTSHRSNCQSPQQNHNQLSDVFNTIGPNTSVPSSPLSTLLPTTPLSTTMPSLPPYATDYLSSNSHQHHNSHTPNDQQIPQQYFHDHLIHQSQEFLPLCDLLFNIISLAAYFCDVLFDSITAYILFLEQDFLWLFITVTLILFSALVSQILSYQWYWRKSKDRMCDQCADCQSVSVLSVHILLCGVLWRYFKLFIPVDLSSVKNEVRDLCLLRMVHAFCSAAPMLTIQVYLLWNRPSMDIQNRDLTFVSIFLSLFSVCWALASFSKNVRSHNIHKLVLTWLGVIFQFFWRLGTIGSRVIALTIYATVYSYWIFAVIILHWFSMFLWLLSPKNLFYGEKMSSFKRLGYTSLIAWVYIFCYINMQEDNSQNRMIAFYSIMFLENSLLLGISLFLSPDSALITSWLQEMSFAVGLGGFAVGMLFMIIYYKFFHIRHLKHTLLVSNYDINIEYQSNHCPEHGDQLYGNNIGVSETRLNQLSGGNKLQFPLMNHPSNSVMSGIPGVFNCRLNPALKRKKKKPSTFIPPPHPHITAANTHSGITSPIITSNNLGNGQNSKNLTKTTKAPPLPSPSTFWKKSEVANGFLQSKSISPAIASSPLTLSTKHPFSASIAPSPVVNFTTDLNQQLLSTTIKPTVNKPQMVPNIPPNTTPTPVPSQRKSNINNNCNGKLAKPKAQAANTVSKVNIQQKLEEKKQQQFMQLRKIEEEIKQGIISKPHIIERIKSPKLIQKTAPQTKRQPYIMGTSRPTASNHTFAPLSNRGIHYYYHPVYRRLKLRSQTPEVLLEPHYLDNSRIFYDYPSCVLPPIHSRLLKVPLENSAEEEEEAEEEVNNQRNDNKVETNNRIISNNIQNFKNLSNKDNDMKMFNNSDNNQVINRITSDIDSHMSLPRSYTLPREFQYARAGHTGVKSVKSAINKMADSSGYLRTSSRIRRPLSSAAEQYVDTNSSNDGDVDSDVNPDEDYDITAVPKIIRGPANQLRSPDRNNRTLRDYHLIKQKRQETPL